MPVVATLSTGPSYSTSGKLVGPSTSASIKIDPSRELSSPYQPLFDENVPTAPTPLPTGTASIGTSGGSTTYYYAGDVDLTGSQTLTVNGPVVLVLSGHLYLSNTAQIVLARLLIFGEGAWLIAPPFLALGTVTAALLGVFAERFAARSRWLASVKET